MPDKKKPTQGRRISGGPVKQRKPTKEERGPEQVLRYESVPPEERKQYPRQEGVTALVKTIVVRDERGQVVSVTKISPDAKFGVGVKPQAGQTVKEYEAGTLAEDPFAGPQRD